MIYRSLLNRFIYLIGLMVTCFLHFSCHSLSSSMLGDSPSSNTNDQTQSASDSVALSNQTNKAVRHSMAFAGHGKLDNKIQTGSAGDGDGWKVGQFCEDAFGYLTRNGKTTLVIADGVGSYHKHSGALASKLVNYLMSVMSSTSISLEKMIRDAFTEICNNQWCKIWCKEACKGACKRNAATTCCMATIDKGQLCWANIGDSGLRVVRNGSVCFKTEESIHKFNQPYALFINKGIPNENQDKADSGDFTLEKGDVVIMATDGVFDNLFDEELSSIVDPTHSAQIIATNIVTKALEISKVVNKQTPNAHKRFRNYKELYPDGDPYYTIGNFLGGKKDDISVVVAMY